MIIEELRRFLVAANKAGYAGGDEKKWIKEENGSTTIPFNQDSWKLDDNFFGGEPYGGRMVVFNQKKAVWMMVYYGWVNEGISPDLVYSVLRGALMQMPEDHPYRGPKIFAKDGLTYTNKWNGELDRFSGEEVITKDNQVIYKANYFGGEVDKK